MKKVVYETSINWKYDEFPIWAFAAYIGRNWYGPNVYPSPWGKSIHVCIPARGFDAPQSWEIRFEKKNDSLIIKVIEEYPSKTTDMIIRETKEVIKWLKGLMSKWID